MHEHAVGLAVADRRPVRLARGVHQNCRAIREREAGIAPGRGVALQILRYGVGVRRRIDETGECLQALQPRPPASASRQHHAAAIGLRRLVHGDVEPVIREPVAGALGPFNKCHGACKQVVEAELGKLARLQPIEVAMMHGEARTRISLHQREGRARHLARDAESCEQKPSEARLAGAERAGERDKVPRLQHKGETLGETIERDEVDAIEAPACAHPARLDP